MTNLRRLVALGGLLAGVAAFSSDWTMDGGDPRRSHWLSSETDLTAGNAGRMKLLWKRQLEPAMAVAPGAPLILGPIVTHRGIKELVFVTAGQDNIYAVDADLGRIFWKRHFERALPPGCGSTPISTPAIAAIPLGPGEEAAAPKQIIYFVSSDGQLRAIRPADGADVLPSRQFVPPDSKVSSLNLAAGFAYAATGVGCGAGPEGVWALDVNRSSEKPGMFSVDGFSEFGVSIGNDGSIYAAHRRAMVSLSPGNLKLRRTFALAAPAVIPFRWKEREWLAAPDHGARLVLLDPGGEVVAELAARGLSSNMATWEDPGGIRWIYASAAGVIRAVRLEGTANRPVLVPVWTSRDMAARGAIAGANGVLVALSSGPVRLFALDARSGKELYSSSEAIPSAALSGGLSVANGHVCFTTSDNVLYCFGLPIEI
jgi:outer membrane protein assembly factor BamB